MESDAFFGTIGTLEAVQRALAELVTNQEVMALVTRCTPIAILIGAIFGGGIDTARLRRLDVAQLRAMVKGAERALSTLEPDERNCIIDFFGLGSIEGFEKDAVAAVNPDTRLVVILRKMKHPSRSRLLRTFYDLVDPERPNGLASESRGGCLGRNS
ncbi:hypothetical protein ACQR0V_22510 [Bradyrhizobium sp. HKCCYLS2058]|uniref:hypothetical protein n=1 Tax=unclassified Bradyrhizobium TaxID=2631580 RepID=UPI003EBFB43F